MSHEIGTEESDAILQFFATGKLPIGYNETTVTLVFKIDMPSQAIDYRPIACKSSENTGQRRPSRLKALNQKGWRRYLPSKWTYIVRPDIVDTLPVGRPNPAAVGKPIATLVVIIARHTNKTLPKSRMMARTKQTVRKSSLLDPHVAHLATMPSAEQARPTTQEEDIVGDVEVQEMDDQGEVRLGTPSEAEEEGAAWRLPFGSFNEEGQLVFEVKEILEAGEDYVTEEYVETVPLRRQWEGKESAQAWLLRGCGMIHFLSQPVGDQSK
uniref:Uncharacterized protein n=1 Tax=Cannabis sativa TaxID=3483 RepID=A0A803QBG3_CANSA